MFRGGLTGLAGTGLVDCPGPELVNLFFLQATHEGLERGGPVGFENFWKFEIEFRFLFDDVMSNGAATVETGDFPSECDALIVPIVNLDWKIV
jgi:hypothetical protein